MSSWLRIWSKIGILLVVGRNAAECFRMIDSHSRCSPLTTNPHTLCLRQQPMSLNRSLCQCRMLKDLFAMDFQSDESKYGRGEWHLSADLYEGDVVVYQTGTWYVDGVAVGEATISGSESTEPRLEYAQIDTIQVVWTHNCEHGVIRGTKLVKVLAGDMPPTGNEIDGDASQSKQSLLQRLDDHAVEFGPEQLVARLPVREWREDEESGSYGKTICLVGVDLENDDQWILTG